MNIDRGDKSPFSYNPLSSPRGKTTNSSRGQTPGLEYQFIVNFVKTNLKLFLRIIASDIHNTETSLNSSEFNTLKFLFKVYDTDNNIEELRNKNWDFEIAQSDYFDVSSTEIRNSKITNSMNKEVEEYIKTNELYNA